MKTKLIATAAASVAVIAPAVAAHAGSPTPPNFRVSPWSGTATTVGAESFFTGKGFATLLGAFTSTGQATVTGADNTTCVGGVANTNVETLTNAHGDSVTVSSQDVACPTGPGQFHGSGHWTVTAGTGRFRNATGSGSFDGHSDFVAGTFAATMTGTIVGLQP